MAVDDLWYRKDPKTGKKVPAKRHGRGNRWRVRYVDDNGKPRQPTFDKKSEAIEFDAGVRTDVARGNYIDPEAGKITVEEYSKTWRETQLHRYSTAEHVERYFRLHINPVLGRHPMKRIVRSHVQMWVKNSRLGPVATRLAFWYLNAMFTAAVHDKIIATSPCVGITLPELEQAEHLILSPKQVHELAALLPDRYRAAVYVAAGCGLRPSETFGLELDQVAFLRREIDVQHQIGQATGRGSFLAPPKTKTSLRTVELPKITADALAEHIRKYPPAEIELVDATDPDPRKHKARQVKLLFTDDKGRPLTRGNWSKIFQPAAQALGLPPRSGLHLLRHYFATLLIFNGANVKTVQMALGHATPTITLNTYVGLWPDQIDRTRNLVDQALGTMPAHPATAAR